MRKILILILGGTSLGIAAGFLVQAFFELSSASHVASDLLFMLFFALFGWIVLDFLFGLGRADID